MIMFYSPDGRQSCSVTHIIHHTLVQITFIKPEILTTGQVKFNLYPGIKYLE